MFLRACPRCRGDMHLVDDQYGPYKQCIHCGYIVEVEPPVSRRPRR